MLTTKKAVEAKASSIRTIKSGSSITKDNDTTITQSNYGKFKDDVFTGELKKSTSTSIFFMVSDIDNKRSAASWKAKYQRMIKCN